MKFLEIVSFHLNDIKCVVNKNFVFQKDSMPVRLAFNVVKLLQSKL